MSLDNNTKKLSPCLIASSTARSIQSWGSGPALDSIIYIPADLLSITAFQQQRLKAWRPLLRPSYVIPFLLLIGIICIPLGGVFIASTSNVFEIFVDYTNCHTTASSTFSKFSNDDRVRWKRIEQSDQCILQFEITQAIPGPILLYYQLGNYYQNQRQYVKSVESSQLSGSALTYSQLSNCAPLQGPSGFDSLGDARPVYYPCGLVANSLFNDTFSSLFSVTGGPPIQFDSQDIAFSYDLEKFSPSQYQAEGSPLAFPPLYWQIDPNLLSSDGSWKVIPNISIDQHFIVWMRNAGLPNFRKLFGSYQGNLLPGIYTMEIMDRFSVTPFGGTKAVLLTNNSYLGGKNYLLGIAYLVVGILFLLFGLFFLILRFIYPRKLGDLSLLSWVEKEPTNLGKTELEHDSKSISIPDDVIQMETLVNSPNNPRPN